MAAGDLFSRLRRTPWLVGLVVAVPAAAGLYGGFALADPGPPVNASVGGERELALEEGEAVELGLSWTTTLDLDDPPQAFDVLVALPYTVDPEGPSADGARVWTNVTVNGETAARHLLHPSSGHVKLTFPGPHLDADTLEQGSNEIEAQVEVHRPASANGSANLTVGPLIAEAELTDGDGDGIVDTRQPIASLPTGWVALATGVALGAPAAIAARFAAGGGREGSS